MTPGGFCHRLVFFLTWVQWSQFLIANSWDCLSAKTRNQLIPVVYSWLVPPPTSVCFFNVVFTAIDYPTIQPIVAIFLLIPIIPKGQFYFEIILIFYWYSHDNMRISVCVLGHVSTGALAGRSEDTEEGDRRSPLLWRVCAAHSRAFSMLVNMGDPSMCLLFCVFFVVFRLLKCSSLLRTIRVTESHVVMMVLPSERLILIYII